MFLVEYSSTGFDRNIKNKSIGLIESEKFIDEKLDRNIQSHLLSVIEKQFSNNLKWVYIGAVPFYGRSRAVRMEKKESIGYDLKFGYSSNDVNCGDGIMTLIRLTKLSVIE